MSEQNKTGAEYTPWPESFAQQYRELGLWQGKTLGQAFDEAVEKYSGNTAVIDGELTWTYRELQNRAQQLAAGLMAKGLQPGDKVVVQLPNCAEFFEVLLALFYTGAIPIMALPAHRQREIEYFCQFANARAYIVADQWEGFDYLNLADVVANNTAVEHVFVAGNPGPFTALNTLYQPEPALYQTEGTLNQPVRALPELTASTVALMQLSGGTTNVPKLIPRTHDDYFYSVYASAQICQISEHTVYLAALPLAHNFPLSSPGTLGVLSSGGCVVIAKNGAPDHTFDLIERHNVTFTALVPPLAISWLNAKPNSVKNIASLQVLQVGGARLSAEVAQKIKPVLGCTLQQVFGMAEGLVNYTRLNDSDQIIHNTQGRPISTYDEVLIVNDADQPVEPGTPGHLLTRGPYTIRGYYRADEHNKTAFTHDGFYRTGDIARVTEKGYLQVEGRAKDQINRGGEKISAEEVENQLLAHQSINDAALVSVPDDYLGERACAFLIMKSGEKPLRLPQIKQFLRLRGLAEYKLPDKVVVVDQFPVTSFGKVSKKALRAQLQHTTEEATV